MVFPVWAEGELPVRDTESVLRLVDGTDQIESGYALNVSEIEPFDNIN